MKKRVLGITGGVGCGKSAVLSFLEKEYGAEAIQADRVAHTLMAPGQECSRRIQEAFGEGVLDGEGRIDRAALGALVFGDEEKRRLLNRLTHPAVKQESRRRIAASPKPLVVVEAALLLEDRYDEICDEIWYIHAGRDARFARLSESRGYTRERTQAMMDSQMGEEELRRRCQATVDNSGAWEATRRQLEELLEARGFAAG